MAILANVMRVRSATNITAHPSPARKGRGKEADLDLVVEHDGSIANSVLRIYW